MSGSPSSTSASPPDQVATALTATINAENAAIYAYALAGARLSTSDRSVARGYYDIHRAQVQAVAGWARDRGVTPPPPAPLYALPIQPTDAASAATLLARIEEAAAARYADLVAVASGTLRRAAALALQPAAAHAARWRGSGVPFPGLVGRLPT